MLGNAAMRFNKSIGGRRRKMKKLAALFMVGGLLTFAYPKARAADIKVVMCTCTSTQILNADCTASTGVTVPAECDAGGDSCAQCIATLLNEGFKVTQAASDISNGVQYLLVGK
jgi:hypothetical protein